MIKKDAIIFIENIGLKSLDKDLLIKSDRITMTPNAMLAFEEESLSYLTFNDFYDYKQFRKDNSRLIEDTVKLFSMLDKQYEPIVHFPRSFTGNIHWFLNLFTNMLYLSKISEIINKTYQKVYFISNKNMYPEWNIDLQFSPNGLIFYDFNYGLENKIRILKAFINCEYSFIKCTKSQNNHTTINKRLQHLIKRIPDKTFQGIKSIARKAYLKKGNFFIIQDGYEVALLRPFLENIKLINPIPEILRSLRNKNASLFKNKLIFEDELEKFAKLWFPNQKSFLFELFTQYQDKILGKINLFISNLNKAIDYYKPQGFLYSVHSDKVYEDISAFLANKRRIPVFYFQHGGPISAFFHHPYQRFMEHNDNIEKITLYHSAVEKGLFGKDSPMSPVVGSIKLYNLFLKNKKKISNKKRNILYCAMPFNSYNYRELMHQVPDADILNSHQEIVETISKFDIAMDIKVSPCDEKYEVNYFSNLLESLKTRNIRIIKGIAADEIITDYSLLILDFAVTALLPSAFVVDIPVILYLKETSYLRKETLQDLKDRFYLLNSKTELDEHIAFFKKGELMSKFSYNLIDKYIFPIDKGNIGISVSNYFKNAFTN